jgi:dTDP-4-amino-4,6-dideoxygalactose transaminase
MINVTKTYLPPLDKYIATLRQAWDKSWITNNGGLVQELERRLKAYLGVKHLFLTANGTVVLQMALKAYEITGEVITTPFSYVATTNVILWEGCEPVFVDIDRRSFCIDADRIETAITEKTQAIVATHVYGYPCEVEKIETVAKKHGLKVIYDGAHAFGCVYKSKSVLGYGDVSTCSFHATKLFHTVEGGCVITDDDEIAERLMLFRQFGHVYEDYYTIGINAKNSEFHAAMGLCVLDDVPRLVASRKAICERYDRALKGTKLWRPGHPAPDFEYNFSYYPVVFPSERALLRTKERLAAAGINTRRYFYPSLNQLPFLRTKQVCAVSEEIATRVLCLPLFDDLSESEQDRITDIVNQTLD